MFFGRKILIGSASLALLAATVTVQPAAAQQAAITVGGSIVDTEGGAVGSVTAVDGDFVTIRTDRHEVRLPRASFTPHEGNYIFGMTRAQLNAEVERAQQAPVLNAGATVRDTRGGTVGTITEVDSEFATVQLANALVKLPVGAFAAGPQGPVIAMTAAELEAQAAGQ